MFLMVSRTPSLELMSTLMKNPLLQATYFAFCSYYSVLSRYYHCQRQADMRSAARTTIRLLESLIRLAQAHARLMYRSMVSIQDAVVAVTCVECSMQNTALLGGVNALHTRWVTSHCHGIFFPMFREKPRDFIFSQGNSKFLLEVWEKSMNFTQADISFNFDFMLWVWRHILPKSSQGKEGEFSCWSGDSPGILSILMGGIPDCSIISWPSKLNEASWIRLFKDRERTYPLQIITIQAHFW